MERGLLPSGLRHGPLKQFYQCIFTCALNMEVEFSYKALAITYQTTPYHSSEQCFQNLIWKVGVSMDITGQKGEMIETTTYGTGKEAAVMSGKWQRVSCLSWPPGLTISEI
jgi:hypothetical protein